MAKVNLQVLPRPALPTETRTFTDPAQPGVEVELTLTKLDPYRLTVALEAAETWLAELGGNYFPLANGEAYPITLGLARTLCTLEVMQSGPEEERYSRGDLLAMMLAMPAAWLELLETFQKLNEQASGN